MAPQKYFSIRNVTLFGILMILIVTVAVAFGYKISQESTPSQPPNKVGSAIGAVMAIDDATSLTESKAHTGDELQLSKAVLSVRNMSCSGCISTIKSSVAGFTGIKEVIVDLGSGTVEIYYDARQLQSLAPVAKAITDSGYPATILRTLSADQVKKERTLAESRSALYIVSVGKWDISRSDFNVELEAAKERYLQIYGKDLFDSDPGKNLLDSLKAQILSRLIDEGIMMQEILRTGYKVEKEILDKRFQTILSQHGKTLAEFKMSFSDNGYNYEYLRKKYEIKIMIDQYLNSNVLVDASNDYEKKNLFNAWFNNSKTLAKVVYYDKDLEQLLRRLKQSGGCSASG